MDLFTHSTRQWPLANAEWLLQFVPASIAIGFVRIIYVKLYILRICALKQWTHSDSSITFEAANGKQKREKNEKSFQSNNRAILGWVTGQNACRRHGNGNGPGWIKSRSEQKECDVAVGPQKPRMDRIRSILCALCAGFLVAARSLLLMPTPAALALHCPQYNGRHGLHWFDRKPKYAIYHDTKELLLCVSNARQIYW